MKLKIQYECMQCNTIILLEKDRDGINCPRCCGPVLPKPYGKNEKPPITIKHQPLITIELDNMNSVPKVLYKGEEIKNKVLIAFNWETDTDTTINVPAFFIEHVEFEKNGMPYLKTIGYGPSFRGGNHA